MTTPAHWVETALQLKKSGQVTLDSNGIGVLTFDPDHARQRWEITAITITTNQVTTASVVPVVTTAINTTAIGTMSPGNQRDSTWNGNQDTWTGLIEIGPCDFFSVLFSPPTGQGASLSGVIATAVITGTKYTRRL